MATLTFEQMMALFAETREQMKKQSAEADRRAAEADRRAAELDRRIAETSEQIKKQSVENDKLLKDLARQVGGITDTQGRFAEHQVRPKLIQMFRDWGVALEETVFGVQVEREGQPYLEIDLLLINTVCSVVVEIKNNLRERDIDEHIDRLEKLQQYTVRAVKGTIMYGAVAGMIVSAEVAQYAIKKGLFVIVPSGENVEIANPPGFTPAQWKAKGA